MSGVFSSGFSNIDGAGDPGECVRFVDDANAMASFRDATRHSHEALALCAGDRVLDVGCRSAADVRALARIVGPTGRGRGLDRRSGGDWEGWLPLLRRDAVPRRRTQVLIYGGSPGTARASGHRPLRTGAMVS